MIHVIVIVIMIMIMIMIIENWTFYSLLTPYFNHDCHYYHHQLAACSPVFSAMLRILDYIYVSIQN